MISMVADVFSNGPQRIGKSTVQICKQRKNQDHSNYCIIKIGQNTEKSPGDLCRLGITKYSVKDLQ